MEATCNMTSLPTFNLTDVPQAEQQVTAAEHCAATGKGFGPIVDNCAEKTNSLAG